MPHPRPPRSIPVKVEELSSILKAEEGDEDEPETPEEDAEVEVEDEVAYQRSNLVRASKEHVLRRY